MAPGANPTDAGVLVAFGVPLRGQHRQFWRRAPSDAVHNGARHQFGVGGGDHQRVHRIWGGIHGGTLLLRRLQLVKCVMPD